MPTTSNFGWTTPADTDLVKDGAAAIRTLGNGIDTSFLDLKGGTTGQVLSKATNTDLDYTWITPNVGDITEVQAGTGISVSSGTGPIPVVTNTVATAFDAAGDLVYGTGADTFTKLSLGTAGQFLKVNSGATAPEWGSAGGGYTQLDSGSLSGSVTTISGISGDYRDLVLILRNFQTTSGSGYGLRVNGETSTSAYRGCWIRDAGGSGSVGTIGANSYIQGHLGNDMATGNNGNAAVWTVNDYANTSSYKTVNAATHFLSSGPTEYAGWIAGSYESTTAVTELGIVNASSTWSGGTYVLYGVK